MPFQFYCPAGHLLLGDEAEAGQVRNCPCCGAPFVVPQTGPTPEPSPPVGPTTNREIAAPPIVRPSVQTKPPDTAPKEVLVHIPCPAGHELETPREMLGQEALCPFCRVQFRLRLEDSVEYREEQERREREAGQKWLKAAIAAAVVVVGAVILMIVMTISRR